MSFFTAIFKPSPRGRIRWTVFLVFIIFVVTLSYDVTEVYNKNLDSINNTVHNIGLKQVNLGKIEINKKYINDVFRLGLDLQGGTHLVYEADVSNVPEKDKLASMDGVRDVIERRINLFGVSEPLVQTAKTGNSYRVTVELAGVKDVNQAIKMIGETPLLQFKEVDESKTNQKKEMTETQKKEMADYNKQAEQKANEVLKKATANGADFAVLAKDNSEELSTKDKAGDIGWVNGSSYYADLLPATSKLNIGQVSSELVKSSEGYNVIKLQEKKEGEKEVKARHILICYKGATKCEKETSKEDAKKKIDDLKKQANPANFESLAKANSTEPNADKSGGDLGWFTKGSMVKAFEDATYNMAKGAISDVVETEFGYHIIYKEDERPTTEYKISRILIKTKSESDYLPAQNEVVWKETPLTGKQLKRSGVDFDQAGNPEVKLDFNDEGKKLFGEITSRNVGKTVGIFLDGEPISTPGVEQAIMSGSAVIQGDFDINEAKLLAQRLNTGALPVKISPISQQTVGPSLGAESLQKSLMAGLIGFLLVAIFMILYYRLPGLISVIALCVYTAIALAIFKIWPITLTLAGIAGFVLSIGMAVDANVLIFERIKEELRWGNNIDVAIKEGFKRAWTSIRDSNISSLITCAVLFWFSASLIKGFALTLAIGILVSMFSAVVITRILLKLVVGWKISKVLWLFNGKNDKTNS